MGYFGVNEEIRYWSVTCKRCRQTINFAHFDAKGHLYDQISCVVAVECPRCRDRRRYLPTEVWRHRITTHSHSSAEELTITPIFIKFPETK